MTSAKRAKLTNADFMTISESALRLERPVHDIAADVKHGLVEIRTRLGAIIIEMHTLAFWSFCAKKS
jgi:hypothetical protein